MKAYKDPRALIHAYIGSLTWSILALIALMSTILALLYSRHRRYYVEHFVFLLHYHTGLMLTLLLAIIGIQFSVFEVSILAWLALWASISMYFALRRYYQQGIGKTIAKWFIFGFLYYLSFVVLFVLGIILVFAIF